MGGFKSFRKSLSHAVKSVAKVAQPVLGTVGKITNIPIVGLGANMLTGGSFGVIKSSLEIGSKAISSQRPAVGSGKASGGSPALVAVKPSEKKSIFGESYKAVTMKFKGVK